MKIKTLSRKMKIALGLGVTAALLAAGAAIALGIHQARNSVRFTVNDTLPDGKGKKATVILLAGQSNAAGCSSDEYLKKNVSAEQYAEYEQGYDNVYINYYISGTNESKGFVKCTTRQGEAGGYFGPELGLADKLNELYPDETFFIIKYTWSGTSLSNRWLSPSSAGRRGDLYDPFVDFVRSSMDYLLSKNYDAKIEGSCWMQGESDACSVEASENYGRHLSNFIEDLRKEFSAYAAADSIAFVDAYIAANPAYWIYYEAVNRGKNEVAEQSSMNTLVDTIAHGLTCSQEPEGTPDMAHYDSLSELKLGHLFAQALTAYFDEPANREFHSRECFYEHTKKDIATHLHRRISDR